MITVTMTFNDLDELTAFVGRTNGGVMGAAPVQPVEPAMQQTAPVVQSVQPAPTAPVQPATTPVQPAPTVPTAAVSYTVDDLAAAAMILMDSGRQQELIGLLQTFGVAALPELKQEQYGAFATALRGLGAKI